MMVKIIKKFNFNKKIFLLSSLVIFMLTVSLVLAGSGRTIQGNVYDSDGNPAENVLVTVHTKLSDGCECSTLDSVASYTDSNGAYAESSGNLRFDTDCGPEGTNLGDDCDGSWSDNDLLWISVTGSSANPVLPNDISFVGSSYTWDYYYLGEPEFADVISLKLPDNSDNEENEEEDSGFFDFLSPEEDSNPENTDLVGEICTNECEEGSIECLGKQLYQTCVKIGDCTTWKIIDLESGSECANGQILPLGSGKTYLEEGELAAQEEDLPNQGLDNVQHTSDQEDSLSLESGDEESELSSNTAFLLLLVLMIVIIMLIILGIKHLEERKRLNTIK